MSTTSPSAASASPSGSSTSRLSLAVPRSAPEVAAIGLGGVLFLATGFAMEWRPGFAVCAAVGFACATWLARSLGRALICALASMGLVAALMALIGRLDPGIAEVFGVGWGAIFVAWWLGTIVLAFAYRRSRVEPDFGLPLALGCCISIAIALVIAAKLDFSANLLFYIVAHEDNAAWVSLATQNASADAIAPQFGSALGPVMPLMLGVLAGVQGNGAPASNSVFAAYSLAVILCPLFAGALLRGANLSLRARWIQVAFTLIAFAWLFLAPALLYKDFGHLSAIWTIYGLVAFISLAVFDEPRPALIPIAIGGLLFTAGAWFPIAPLAGLLALGFALSATRDAGTRVRAGIFIAFLLALALIVLQLRSSGVALGTNLSALKLSLEGLYESPGGVAEVDPVLRALVVVGIVALSFLASRVGPPGKRLSLVLVIFLGYSAAVYAGSALLNSGAQSYGAMKVAFVVLIASAVVLVSIVPQFALGSEQYVAATVALAFGAMTLGGGTLLLQRSWPGDGTFPSWLGAVEKVVRGQDASRPIACFASNDGQAAYACMRWAGALLKVGDGAYLRYRLRAVKGTVSAEDIQELRKSGVLPQSDIIFLDRPTEKAWWGKILLREGGRVYGPTGEPLANRTVSAIELLPPPTPAQ